MHESILRIAIAGFIHDIGKLAAEGTMKVTPGYLLDNADLYQPFHKGRHTHRHAVYTAAFIEQMDRLLPEGLKKAEWGLDESFINLAAGHHRPMTPLQWIIAIADRVSSGWDRTKFETEYNQAAALRDYRKARLLPLFETLKRETGERLGTDPERGYCYRLKAASPGSIFPVPYKEGYPNNPNTAASEYESLFDGFTLALEGLLHREESLSLWFEHFESLVMMYCSSIPAARAGNVIPDVSLYDHLKSTSALAAALYAYHRATDSMTVDAIKSYDARKFLVISGDFYGIQSFIFSDGGESRKNRSKLLRGRSFAVSLFSELAANRLCEEIGLPSSSIVLNAAGKFTLIAPNTEQAKSAIATVEARLNEWLMKITYGESSIGIGFLEASPEDFVSGKFYGLWDELGVRMEGKKFHKLDLGRFGGSIDGYLDTFRNDLKRPLCPFCGKRPSSPKAEGSPLIGEDQSACSICRDHIFLGSNLVKKRRLALIASEARAHGKDNRLLEPIFGVYQAAFPENAMAEEARSGQLLKLWDIASNPLGNSHGGATGKVHQRLRSHLRKGGLLRRKIVGRSQK